MLAGLREIWELQQTDTSIVETERKIKALDNGAAALSAMETARQQHQEAAAALHAIETELKDIELNVKSNEMKSKDFERKLYSGKVTNPKELEAIQQEIAMLAKARDKMETRELELMDLQADARLAEETARVALEDAEKNLKEILSTYKAAKYQLESELVELKTVRAELAKAAARADESVLRKYENLLPKLGNLAVSAVNGSTCSACKISISSTILAEIRKGSDIIFCESCGRILYHVTQE